MFNVCSWSKMNKTSLMSDMRETWVKLQLKCLASRREMSLHKRRYASSSFQKLQLRNIITSESHNERLHGFMVLLHISKLCHTLSVFFLLSFLRLFLPSFRSFSSFSKFLFFLYSLLPFSLDLFPFYSRLLSFSVCSSFLTFPILHL